jgi:hypothetical protein
LSFCGGEDRTQCPLIYILSPGNFFAVVGFVFFFFQTGFHYVTEAGLKLVIFPYPWKELALGLGLLVPWL